MNSTPIVIVLFDHAHKQFDVYLPDNYSLWHTYPSDDYEEMLAAILRYFYLNTDPYTNPYVEIRMELAEGHKFVKCRLNKNNIDYSIVFFNRSIVKHKDCKF